MNWLKEYCIVLYSIGNCLKAGLCGALHIACSWVASGVSSPCPPSMQQPVAWDLFTNSTFLFDFSCSSSSLMIRELLLFHHGSWIPWNLPSKHLSNFETEKYFWYHLSCIIFQRMKILNIFLLLLNSKAQATDEWPLVSTDHSANLTAQVTYPWSDVRLWMRTF